MVGRSDGYGADRESHARRVQRVRAGLRRGTLDDPGGDRRGGSGRSADGSPVHALPLAAKTYLRGEDALRHATEIRWSRRTPSTGEEVIKAATRHDLPTSSKPNFGYLVARNPPT